MDFRLLGPFEVATDEGAAEVGGGKRAALLAYLLINANEVVSTDRLIDELWGEHPPATAAKSVQVYVSQLRKALHTNGEVLGTRGSGYVLNIDDGDLDVKRFERGLTEARAALGRGEPARAAEVARAALELWRGPALYDVAYESFAQSEVGRLDELRLVALETRIEAELALGDHDRLAGELESLVAANPVREHLRAQLMLALYRCGRQSEALETYREGARVLMDERGLEPSPELRELERKILTHDAELAPPRVKRAGTPRRNPQAIAPPDAPIRRRRPAWLLVAGGALLAVAATLALLESGGGGRRPPQASPGDTVLRIDPRTGRTAKVFTVGYTPASVTVGDGAVWALSADDQTISRIDQQSGSVDTFAVGATPTDVVAGAGALWVGAGTIHTGEYGAEPDRVLEVDPDRESVRAQVGLPGVSGRSRNGAPGQVAVGAGAVWALGGGEALTRIDPRTARTTAINDELRLQAISATRRSLWAIVNDTTDVVQIDPRTLRVRRRVHLEAAGLDAIATGADVVWVADANDGTLWRIDLGGKLTTRTVDVGTGAVGVAVGAGAVWAINSLHGTVVRVDPRTDKVTWTISVGGTPRDLAVGAGSVWVARAGSTHAVRTAGAAAGLKALPRSSCGSVQSLGGRTPDYLIASDFPFDPTDAVVTQPMANAVAFVLRSHGFRAGRYRLGYQSCGDATQQAQSWDAGKCTANAHAYAATPQVLGIVGPRQSACTAAELPTLNRAGVAIVSPTNDDLELTRADPTQPRGALHNLYPTGTRNFVRIEPSEKAEAAANAVLAQRLGVHRMYVLDDGEPYGLRNAALLRSALSVIGLRFVGSGHWDPGGKGFGALVRSIRRARADGIYLSGLSSPPSWHLIQVLRKGVGPRPVFITPIGMGPIDSMLQYSGGAAAGVYSSDVGSDVPELSEVNLSPAGRAFVHDFGATQPGVPVTASAVYAAAATQVLLDAIARSNGTRASVAHALLRTRLPDSMIGPLSFDRYGDVRPARVTILRVAAKRVSSVPYNAHAAFYTTITPPEPALR